MEAHPVNVELTLETWRLTLKPWRLRRGQWAKF
jgi:hypothetical protein